MTNEERAEKAYRTLINAGFDVHPQEMDASITDLVADLLHLAHQYDIEPDYITHTAQMHYQAEVEEEAGLC